MLPLEETTCPEKYSGGFPFVPASKNEIAPLALTVPAKLLLPCSGDEMVAYPLIVVLLCLSGESVRLAVLEKPPIRSVIVPPYAPARDGTPLEAGGAGVCGGVGGTEVAVGRGVGVDVAVGRGVAVGRVVGWDVAAFLPAVTGVVFGN